MARYMFLLYDVEEGFDVTDEQAVAAEFALHEQFIAAVAEAGASVLGGEALEPSSTATTVRTGSGQALLTDGPFADTKEALGGFYLIDAPDLDVALRLAQRCPCPNVEVRPLMDMPGDEA